MALARLDIPGLLLYGGSIAPGRFAGPRRHHPGRLRSGRRARGRHGCPTPLCAKSRTTRARAPARAAASSPPTPWRRHASSSGWRRWAAATCPRPTRARPALREHAGRLVDGRAEARYPAAADRHPRIARKRNRLGRGDRRLDQCRPAPDGDRPRSRRRAEPRGFRPDQRTHAAARGSQAGRTIRRHRSAPRRRHPAGRAASQGRRSAPRRRDDGERQDDRRRSRRGRRNARARKSCGRVDRPLKPTGGLVILRGNLAPDGCVVKVAGHDFGTFRGPARVFESEEARIRSRAGRPHQGWRRRRHSSRRAEGRARHARDARRHGRDRRRRTRRLGRADHRRPLLRARRTG